MPGGTPDPRPAGPNPPSTVCRTSERISEIWPSTAVILDSSAGSGPSDFAFAFAFPFGKGASNGGVGGPASLAADEALTQPSADSPKPRPSARATSWPQSGHTLVSFEKATNDRGSSAGAASSKRNTARVAKTSSDRMTKATCVRLFPGKGTPFRATALTVLRGGWPDGATGSAG